MPFWHEQLDRWQQAWRNEGLPALPRVSLTPPDRQGILTFNIFPLLSHFRGNAQAAAEAVLRPIPHIQHSEVIKGFLNLHFSVEFWRDFLTAVLERAEQGYTRTAIAQQEHLMIEYPSPNTNKPLHLGHLRNLCMGESVSRLWERLGARVVRANLVNDRGIHISKSMLGWKKFFAPLTPETARKKGDHFVGDCYVAFEKAYKEQVDALLAQGMPESEALIQAPLFQEAQHLLRLWEKGDPETLHLWKTMNDWVYAGFDATFARLGIRFDKVYYESQTYTEGKKIVEQGLQAGLFYRAEDGSAWADLSAEGLGQKILLRRDGTSVYITQDLGTADLKFRDYPTLTRSVYVIGNEQDHHMRVLIALLRRLGRTWADKVYHLSYGMVELPTGRMKTREGTVVDADDLLEEMHARAYELTDPNLPEEERHAIAEAVGQGALRFYLLRTDPSKNIVFDPAESIDLKGFTGPFLQYGYVRAQRLYEKATQSHLPPNPSPYAETLHPIEESLLQQLYALPSFLESAATTYNPALLAHYGYELTRRFNELYQNLPVLHAEKAVGAFRLMLVVAYQKAIGAVLEALAIPLPAKM
ncbi:MAG: arginine--tRNA ligase [Bacteroidia bacterium]|nr:arginine--tRNA ligase [Bacteroidia bacterium]MDW8235056.1 arginine--tRNA ligase [Bacteroidia bacterium]